MADYNNMLLKSIDTVVQQRLSEINYDETALYKIVDVKDRKQGKYKISDGSVSWTAVSDIYDLSLGDQVYAITPKGDQGTNKLIISKYYKAPDVDADPIWGFDTFSQLKEIKDENLSNNLTIKANSTTLSTGISFKGAAVLDASELDITNMPRLGVEFQAKTNFSSTPTKGAYGLRVELVQVVASDAEGELTTSSYFYELSSKDMFGPIYNFETWTRQQLVIDTSGLSNISQIKFYVFQDKQFDNTIVSTGANDIGIRVVRVASGYSAEDIDVAQLFIEAKNADNDIYEIQAKVFYKQDNGKVVEINKDNISEYNDMSLFWYRYQGGALNDGFGGRDYARLDVDDSVDENGNNKKLTSITEKTVLLDWTDGFIGNGTTLNYDVNGKKTLFNIPISNKEVDIFNIGFKPNNQSYLIKAVLVIGNKQIEVLEKAEALLDKYGSEEDVDKKKEFGRKLLDIKNEYNNCASEAISIQSDPIDFYDSIIAKSLEKGNISGSLFLDCEDFSNGSYLCYDYDNSLLEPYQSQIERKLTVYISLDQAGRGEKLNVYQDSIQWVEWAVPANNSSIIWDSKYRWTEPSDQNIDSYKTIRFEGNDLKDGFYLDYKISHFHRNGGVTNETIFCSVSYKDKIITGNKSFQFGTYGTNGSDYNLVLSFADGRDAVKSNDTAPFEIEANLYDSNNNNIGITNEQLEWKWKQPLKDEDSFFVISTKDSSSNKIKLTLKSNKTDFSQNFNILQVDYEILGKDQQIQVLSAYLPIPIKEIPSGGKDVFVNNGFAPIIYDSQGNLFNKGNRIIFYEEGDLSTPLLNNTDSAKINIYDDTVSEQNYPICDGQNIIPLSFYTKTSLCNCVITCSKGDITYGWYNPLLIVQNTFPSKTINDWDGKVTVDEDGNFIASAQLVAGKKENGAFTGVAMGDLHDKSDLSLSQVGLYGFHNGQQVFAFKEDGSAFIGSENARIEFNDNKSIATIKNAGYDEKTKNGILIDLNNGEIDLKRGQVDNDDQKYVIYHAKLDASVKSDSSDQSTQDEDFISIYKQSLVDGQKSKETLFSINYQGYVTLNKGKIHLDQGKYIVDIDVDTGISIKLNDSSNTVIFDTNDKNIDINDLKVKNTFILNEKSVIKNVNSSTVGCYWTGGK